MLDKTNPFQYFTLNLKWFCMLTSVNHKECSFKNNELLQNVSTRVYLILKTDHKSCMGKIIINYCNTDTGWGLGA